jgi:hypothetical protein
MTGTHGRDRPILADDGGVGVRVRRPLRLSRRKPGDARATSPTSQGRTKSKNAVPDVILKNACWTVFSRSGGFGQGFHVKHDPLNFRKPQRLVCVLTDGVLEFHV